MEHFVSFDGRTAHGKLVFKVGWPLSLQLLTLLYLLPPAGIPLCPCRPDLVILGTFIAIGNGPH
jgi:hypothetical protein